MDLTALGDAVLRLILLGILWSIARYFGEYTKRSMTSLGAAMGVVSVAGILSLMAWANYGTHTERDDVDDAPVRVVDFHPSGSARVVQGLTVLLIVVIVGGHGTWYGRTRTD